MDNTTRDERLADIETLFSSAASWGEFRRDYPNDYPNAEELDDLELAARNRLHAFVRTATVPVNGGYDLENMNGKRADWGYALADLIQELTGTDRHDAVSDAIGDLLHAAVRMGQDPARELARAVQHFNEETAKELD